MSTQVQYRRGTATQNNAFTGALAEITVDTTNWTLRVHDGVTAGGGGNVATVAYVTAQIAALSANSITDGTSNVKVYNSGNVAVTVAGTANVAVFKSTGANITGTFDVSGNVTGGNLITAGLITATGAITGAAISGTTISGSGNVTGANINTAGLVSATGNVNCNNLNVTGGIFDPGVLTLTTAASGSIALAPNGSNVLVVSTTGETITGTISATGTITGAGLISTGTITTAGNITTSGANSVANIGAVGAFFNTVHARATSAQYADVAEYYTSDANYESGTVVVFGGSAEVTVSNKPADNTVAGVVSTNPAYIMNAGIQSQQSVAVALTGRVPTRVLGPVRKGNMMVSAPNGYAQACATPAVGTVIGKAIENFDGDQGIIEIVVGRV